MNTPTLETILARYDDLTPDEQAQFLRLAEAALNLFAK